MRSAIREQILALSLEFFSKWSAGLSDQAFYDARDETIRRIMDLEGVAEDLAPGDVLDALQNVVMYAEKGLRDLTEQELRQHITGRILTETQFVGIYPVYSLYRFPKGMQIGPGTVVLFADLPVDVQEAWVSMWEDEFDRHPGVHKAREEFMQERRDCLFLEFQTRACGFEKAAENTHKDAEDSAVVLRLLYDRPLHIAEYVIRAEGRGYHARSYDGVRWGQYLPVMNSTIQLWTDILTKRNPTDLEGRMRRALRLAGLGVAIERKELEFVLLTIGLETLLLTRGDSDYLRHRLSEKAAFLLESDGDRRIDMFRRARDIYDKRSKFVHTGLSEVSTEDLNETSKLFWQVMTRFRGLREEGYVAVEKSGAAKTVDALVESLKFH